MIHYSGTKCNQAFGNRKQERRFLTFPVDGTVDSIILRPRVFARRSAFTRFTLAVVMDSRIPLMTIARSSLHRIA